MNSIEKIRDMPMIPLVFRMSLPSMFSLLSIALFNIVDSIFVSQLGEEALTAVSIVYPIQTLAIAIADGSAIGANSLISRRLGEQRKGDAICAANNAIFIATLSYILYTAILFLFLSPYLLLFTQNAAILSQAKNYADVVILGSCFIFVSVAFEKIFQAAGNVVVPMVALLLGTVLNILLDPIMIFGMFGCPAMGVTGAAIATSLSEAATLLTDILYLRLRPFVLKPNFHRFRPDWQTIKAIYAVGFPSMLIQAMNSFLIVFLNMILAGVSATAIAVLGIYYKLKQFVYMPVYGLCQGVMPIMGYHYGARKKTRLFSAFKIGCAIAFCIMGIGTSVFLLLPSSLLSFFHPSGAMESIGIPALCIVGLGFCPAAINTLMVYFFEAIGKGTTAFVLSFLTLLILPISFGLVQMGIFYFWFAFPMIEIVCLVAGALLFWREYRRNLVYLSA